MRTDDFDYHLPEELIAQHPPAQADNVQRLALDQHSIGLIVPREDGVHESAILRASGHQFECSR